jgi:hypothetical protein
MLSARSTIIAFSVGMLSSFSMADVLVDTGGAGTASIGASSLFNTTTTNGSYQYLAGRINLPTGAVVDQLSGWMGPNSLGGSLDVRLYSDNAGLPGKALYSRNYTPVFRSTAGWENFSNFNAPLPAGTYWMAFEPKPGGFQGTMPSGAPSPLTKYAFNSDGNNRWLDIGAKSLGMRVEGRNSIVTMGSAARGTTRADIPINGNPDGLSTQVGGNGNMNATASVGDGAGKGVVTETSLEAGAFARGYADAPGGASTHSAVGTGHGVAWRPYYNNTAQPISLKLNAVLEGNANNSFGSLNCWLDARVAALDTAALTAQIGGAGGDAATYLLDRHTTAGTYANFPAGTALADKKLNEFFGADSSGLQPKSFELSTGVFTLQPGESFTMLFDVFVQTTGASSGGGSGVLDFMNTLKSATNLFTDANGNAVAGIAAGSTQVIVPEPGTTALLAFGGLLVRRGNKR